MGRPLAVPEGVAGGGKRSIALSFFEQDHRALRQLQAEPHSTIFSGAGVKPRPLGYGAKVWC